MSIIKAGLLMLGLVVVLAVAVWWGWNVVYSVWFSPLRDIPSPVELQLLPLLFDLSVARGNSFLVLHRYHLKYGPVFRIGWKKVIFVDPDAAAQMFGTYKYDKGRIYDGFRYFGDNLLTLKTRAEHSARRKLVVPAFTRPKVLAMEPIIVEKGIRPLLENMEASGGTVDLLKQLHYMSWDVIGELGFGKSFDMLKSRGHPAASWMESILSLAMACYVFPLLLKLRIPNGERLRVFSQKLLDAYSETKSQTILAHFTASVDKETGQALSKEAIFAEAHLLLFAGTETTSNSIGFFFYLLCTNPKVYAKVAAEVRANALDEILTHDQISTRMLYLQAAIKEAMRILPVVASTIFRTVPKDGLQANNYFIPHGTEVTVPFYSIHRSPQLWDVPDQFIPERWLDIPHPSLNRPTDPRCFIPFSIGPRACAGKELAKLEMLLACANILARFDLELATNHPQQKSTELDLVCLPILRPTNSSIFFKVTKLGQ